MRVCGIPVVFDASSDRIARAAGLFSKRIVVGLLWFQLEPEERVAVLFHEAKHCLDRHLEKRVLMLPLLLLAPGFTYRVCRQQELDCDRFAREHGWGAAFASFLCRTRPESSPLYPSNPERLAALQGEQPCSAA